MSEGVVHHTGVGMTALAIINGVIGGSMLIMPLNALSAGWVMSVIVLLVTACISCYTSHLCIIHLGQ